MSDQATTHPLRVAFYARVAHDTDGAHARIAHQAARARAKIEHAPDWTLIESITDTGPACADCSPRPATASSTCSWLSGRGRSAAQPDCWQQSSLNWTAAR